MRQKKNYFWMILTILMVGLLIGLGFISNSARAESADLPRGEMSSAAGFNYELVTVPVSNDGGEMSPKILASITTPADAGCLLDTTGAISYWPLNETSGTTFTDTVGGFNGSCSGDSCPSTITGTNAGGQFFIDTDSDAITAATFSYNFTALQDLSVGIWVKTTQNCAGNKVFIGRYKALDTDGRWWLGCVPGGAPGEAVAMFHMRDSDGFARIATGSTIINNGEWHYIVGVRDGTGNSNKLYVDGNLETTVTSPTFTGNFTSSEPLTMGAYNEPIDYYVNGALDEAAVYGTALSELFIDTYIGTCSFPIDARDVTFDATKNTPLIITAAQLIDGSSGAAALTITSLDGTSEKGGSITGTLPAGPFTYTPATDYVGTDFFTFVLDDGTNSARATAVITQEGPVVTNPGPQTDYEGAVITPPLQIVATDPQEDSLTYAAANLPVGLSIDPLTGIISGVVALNASGSSPYAVTVTVTDSMAYATIVEFIWTINANQVPVIAPPIADQFDREGDLVSLPVVASDADSDTLTYGAVNLPPGLTIISGSGLINGTVSPGASAGSPYSVTVTVDDGKAAPVADNFIWEIKGPNQPPLVVNPGNQGSLEGDPVSLQVQAVDPDGDPLTFSATGLPPTLTINLSGLISGTIAAGASTFSPYTVTVKADDGIADPVPATFTWMVALSNDPPQITQPADQVSTEGDPISLQIVATDPDGDSLEYSALGLPPGLSINASTGLIGGAILSGTSAFSPYTVMVTVDDGIADPVSATFTWTVKGTLYSIYLPLVIK